MMSLAIFEETIYLQNNPDVAEAVRLGLFTSGLQHFQQLGLAEGRVNVSRFYDESFYLARYPGVADAVASGAVVSGLAHFIQFGEAEGRTETSEVFNEQVYLQAYPAVAQAVSQGDFTSGLQHFLLFGQFEGRSPGGSQEGPVTPPTGNAEASFNEDVYVFTNRDIQGAVQAGNFSSGLDHYRQFGQFEGRVALFSGTSGSDIVSGFGSNTLIAGVEYTARQLSSAPDFSRVPTSFGIGEVDTLIGGSGQDTFLLAEVVSTRPAFDSAPPYRFYIGGGEADYAIVQNFTPDQDQIRVGGVPDDYRFESVGGDFRISTVSGDLVAVVQQVTDLQILNPSINLFTLA